MLAGSAVPFFRLILPQSLYDLNRQNALSPAPRTAKLPSDAAHESRNAEEKHTRPTKQQISYLAIAARVVLLDRLTHSSHACLTTLQLTQLDTIIPRKPTPRSIDENHCYCRVTIRSALVRLHVYQLLRAGTGQV